MISTAAVGPVISSTTMKGSSRDPDPDAAAMVKPPYSSLKVTPPTDIGWAAAAAANNPAAEAIRRRKRVTGMAPYHRGVPRPSQRQSG